MDGQTDQEIKCHLSLLELGVALGVALDEFSKIIHSTFDLKRGPGPLMITNFYQDYRQLDL